jgi:hypothetical protein
VAVCRTVLQSNRTAAWVLGAATSAAGFLLVDAYVAVPEVVQYLVLLSRPIEPTKGRLDVEAPPGRRLLRMTAVVVATVSVASEDASVVTLAVTALTFGLVLKPVPKAERTHAVAVRGDQADDDDSAATPTPPWRRSAWRTSK